MKLDLHLHSRYSPDSATRLETLVARCAAVGLDRIALTDHNTTEGALELQRIAPRLAIVGEEVKTTEGEVIGLFITGSIPRGVTPEAACDTIHDMGGLTYLCHPFDRRRASFSPDRVVELAPRLDLIETYNQWCSRDANRAAADICRELDKVAATGSDAHGPSELGSSWMEIEPYHDAADFLERMRHARHVVTETSGTRRRA